MYHILKMIQEGEQWIGTNAISTRFPPSRPKYKTSKITYRQMNITKR